MKSYHWVLTMADGAKRWVHVQPSQTSEWVLSHYGATTAEPMAFDDWRRSIP